MSEKITSNKNTQKVLNDLAEIAGYLWERGWAERNAGNISINITSHYSPGEMERLTALPFFPISQTAPELAGQLILMTITGARMRDLARNPFTNTCFLYFNKSSPVFHLLPLKNNEHSLKPTSELPTHLSIHRMLIQKNAAEKVVLHTHVPELIALTHIYALKSEEAINEILWGMQPETLIFVPEGIGLIPYTCPGTEKMAQATTRGLDKHKVIILEKHGCLAIGTDLFETFDTIDILANSAKIFFLCKNAGYHAEGLNALQIKEIRSKYSR